MVRLGCSATAADLTHSARTCEGFRTGSKVGWMVVK